MLLEITDERDVEYQTRANPQPRDNIEELMQLIVDDFRLPETSDGSCSDTTAEPTEETVLYRRPLVEDLPEIHASDYSGTEELDSSRTCIGKLVPRVLDDSFHVLRGLKHQVVPLFHGAGPARQPLDPPSALRPSLVHEQSTRLCPFLYHTRCSEHGSKRSKFDQHLPDLTGSIFRDVNRASAGGGYSDVWKGVWRRDKVEYQVAIKVIRLYLDDNDHEKERKNSKLRREIDLWRRLDHPHIVPLFGITYDFGPIASMVSPWHSEGNLNVFLERNYDSLTLSRKLCMLTEISEGLEYLHDHQVIHGDLTGMNVLLTAEGTCCLSDFGLSLFLGTLQTVHTTSFRGAVQWAAPELYAGDWDKTVPVHTTCSDIYSLGSIMLQVMTGKIPYYGLNNLQTLCRVVKRIRPDVLATFPIPEQIRDLMNHCWMTVPTERPPTGQILKYLVYLVESSDKVAESCVDFWSGRTSVTANFAQRFGGSRVGHMHPSSYHPTVSPSPSCGSSHSSSYAGPPFLVHGACVEETYRSSSTSSCTLSSRTAVDGEETESLLCSEEDFYSNTDDMGHGVVLEDTVADRPQKNDVHRVRTSRGKQQERLTDRELLEALCMRMSELETRVSSLQGTLR